MGTHTWRPVKSGSELLGAVLWCSVEDKRGETIKIYGRFEKAVTVH